MPVSFRHANFPLFVKVVGRIRYEIGRVASRKGSLFLIKVGTSFIKNWVQENDVATLAKRREFIILNEPLSIGNLWPLGARRLSIWGGFYVLSVLDFN